MEVAPKRKTLETQPFISNHQKQKKKTNLLLLSGFHWKQTSCKAATNV